MAKAKAKVKAKAKPKRKMNAAFAAIVNQKLAPSETLAAVIGASPTTRGQAVKKLWDYFKKHKLNKGREISADELTKPLFGKPKITMFEVGKILKKHLK